MKTYSKRSSRPIRKNSRGEGDDSERRGGRTTTKLNKPKESSTGSPVSQSSARVISTPSGLRGPPPATSLSGPGRALTEHQLFQEHQQQKAAAVARELRRSMLSSVPVCSLGKSASASPAGGGNHGDTGASAGGKRARRAFDRDDDVVVAGSSPLLGARKLLGRGDGGTLGPGGKTRLEHCSLYGLVKSRRNPSKESVQQQFLLVLVLSSFDQVLLHSINIPMRRTLYPQSTAIARAPRRQQTVRSYFICTNIKFSVSGEVRTEILLDRGSFWQIVVMTNVTRFSYRTCCRCCCCFSHSAHWLPTRKKLLYTVANPARGLLNREKKKKKKSGSAPPPPPPPPPCALLVRRKNKNNKIKNLFEVVQVSLFRLLFKAYSSSSIIGSRLLDYTIDVTGSSTVVCVCVCFTRQQMKRD